MAGYRFEKYITPDDDRTPFQKLLELFLEIMVHTSGDIEETFSWMKIVDEEHKITTFKTNPYFPVNTLILMRGAIVAQNEGNLQKYIEAGFHHMWESPKNMGNPDVYLQAMSNSGFDGLDLLEKMQSKEVKVKLILNTREAVKKGTFGMPTFFVEGQMFYGKERLMQIEKIVSD